MQPRVRSALLALMIMVVLVSTAYLAAGALHDRFVPEREEPAAKVTLVQVDIKGLGGAQDLPGLVTTWSAGSEYDAGVNVTGLRSEGGVRTIFSIARDGIAEGDVDVYYYDTVSSSWRNLVMEDRGDSLQAVLGPSYGVAVYPGYYHLYLLVIVSHIDGKCTVEAWAEWD